MSRWGASIRAESINPQSGLRPADGVSPQQRRKLQHVETAVEVEHCDQPVLLEHTRRAERVGERNREAIHCAKPPSAAKDFAHPLQPTRWQRPQPRGSPETKRISSTASQPSSETRTRVARARDEAPAESHDGPPRYVMSQNTFPTTHALSHSLNVDGSQILRDSDTARIQSPKTPNPPPGEATNANLEAKRRRALARPRTPREQPPPTRRIRLVRLDRKPHRPPSPNRRRPREAASRCGLPHRARTAQAGQEACSDENPKARAYRRTGEGLASPCAREREAPCLRRGSQSRDQESSSSRRTRTRRRDRTRKTPA